MQFVHEHLPPIRLKILPNAQKTLKNCQTLLKFDQSGKIWSHCKYERNE